MSAFHSPQQAHRQTSSILLPYPVTQKSAPIWYICANIVKKRLTQHRFPLLRDAFNMESKNFTQLKQIFPK